MLNELSLVVGIGVVDGVLHRRDLFSIFIGDFDAEFIFQGHHQFDRVQESAPRSATKAFSLVT